MTATITRTLAATPPAGRKRRRWPIFVAFAAALIAGVAVVVLTSRPGPVHVQRPPLPPLQAAQAQCQTGTFAAGELVVDVAEDMAGLTCLATRLQMPSAGFEALSSAISAATADGVSGRPVSWQGLAADVSPSGDGARVRFLVTDPATYAHLQVR